MLALLGKGHPNGAQQPYWEQDAIPTSPAAGMACRVPDGLYCT